MASRKPIDTTNASASAAEAAYQRPSTSSAIGSRMTDAA